MRFYQTQFLDNLTTLRIRLTQGSTWSTKYMKIRPPNVTICNQGHRQTFTTQNGLTTKSQIGITHTMAQITVASTCIEQKSMTLMAKFHLISVLHPLIQIIDVFGSTQAYLDYFSFVTYINYGVNTDKKQWSQKSSKTQ